MMTGRGSLTSAWPNASRKRQCCCTPGGEPGRGAARSTHGRLAVPNGGGGFKGVIGAGDLTEVPDVRRPSIAEGDTADTLYTRLAPDGKRGREF